MKLLSGHYSQTTTLGCGSKFTLDCPSQSLTQVSPSRSILAASWNFLCAAAGSSHMSAALASSHTQLAHGERVQVYMSRIVFGFLFSSGFVCSFLVFFPGTICLVFAQFGTRSCHFAWYLLHFGMVTSHFAWYLLHLAMFAFQVARYLPHFGTSTSTFHLHGICYILVL